MFRDHMPLQRGLTQIFEHKSAYFSFCVHFARNPLPADVVTIYAYVQFLSRSLKPPTIKNYLSGVKMLHIFHGLPDVFSDDYLLELEIKGISRINPHVPQRARLITPKVLLVFHQLMDHSDSLHCSVWACSLFLFFTLSRLGSMLPSSRSSQSHKFLTRDRVNLSVEGLLVTFLHTKTIQFGKRRLHIPLLRLDSVLCPVRAFLRASSLSSDGASGPAFTFQKAGKACFLTRSLFIRVFGKFLLMVESRVPHHSRDTLSDEGGPHGPFRQGFRESSFRYAGIG